jgi:hypothetical protein
LLEEIPLLAIEKGVTFGILHMDKRKKLPGDRAKPNIEARRMAFKFPSDEVVNIPYKVLVQKLMEGTNLSEKDIKLVLRVLKKQSRKVIDSGKLIKFPNGYFIPKEDHKTKKKRIERKEKKVKKLNKIDEIQNLKREEE